jgi:hypothetical protein
MSKYGDKKQGKIKERLKTLETEEKERRRQEEIRYMPQTTPYITKAYVKDISRVYVDNGWITQGIRTHEAAQFERDNPLAKGGHGTYAIHEYGGVQLIVELRVRGKQPFFVDIRQKVLELNQLERIGMSRIEILKQKNIDKALLISVVDTTSKYHGSLVDENQVIEQLDLHCS